MKFLHLQSQQECVSNSPCGVERNYIKNFLLYDLNVSNSPCGVEREILGLLNSKLTGVSNSPCGVESFFLLV